MKTLQSLHKIASQKVDKIQEEIAKLLGVMQQMDDREKQLLQQVDYEYNNAQQAGDDALLYSFAGRFSQKAKDEVADIQAARQDAQGILAQKREKLRIQFAEQKRYEILIERKEAEMKKAKAKKEQADLDEVSALRFKSGL